MYHVHLHKQMKKYIPEIGWEFKDLENTAIIRQEQSLSDY